MNSFSITSSYCSFDKAINENRQLSTLPINLKVDFLWLPREMLMELNLRGNTAASLNSIIEA